MGKGRDASDTNAKMTLGCASVTAFFAFIVLIISLGITPKHDPALWKACGNSEGAYKTNCETKDWRRLATESLSTSAAAVAPTEHTNAGFEKFFSNAQQASYLSSVFDLSFTKTTLKKMMGDLFVEPTKSSSKKSKKRLLAAHLTKNDDTCASANDFDCDDPGKKEYKSMFNTPNAKDCADGTDTTDCKGILSSGKCVPGDTKAACSSKPVPANQAACDPYSEGTCAGGGGTECTNVVKGPEATCVAVMDDTGASCAWTSTNVCNYDAPSKCVAGECCCSKDADIAFGNNAFTPSVGVSFKVTTMDTCSSSTCFEKFPLKCTSKYHCRSNEIDPDWAAPAVDEKYGTGGCDKCCGFTKTDSCTGGTAIQTSSVLLWGAVQSYALYACLLIMIGLSPAIFSALSKLKFTDANGNSPGENICGALSVFSTLCCGVIAAGAITAMLFLAGAFLSLACDQSKEYDVAGNDYSLSCTDSCKALRDEQVKVVCDAGGVLGTTSTLLGLCIFLSICSSILVCIGFCNKKQPQNNNNNNVQMSNAAVTQPQPVVQATVMATVVKN